MKKRTSDFTLPTLDDLFSSQAEGTLMMAIVMSLSNAAAQRFSMPPRLPPRVTKSFPFHSGRLRRKDFMLRYFFFFFLAGAARESIIKTAVATPRPIRILPLTLCCASSATTRLSV